jgi:hypothetical protein
MDGLDNAIREIAELVEENKRLREALEKIVLTADCERGNAIELKEIAKEALEG